MHKGHCLCGAVTFEITGDMASPSACHCTQCRRQSGHVWSSTHVPDENLTITTDDPLQWFASSEVAKRGFCAVCGSFLFWKHRDEDATSVSMGALDTPTGLTLSRHIFVADKGDYYDISDTLPQLETS